MQMIAALKKVKPDWFILGLISMILLAALFPNIGGEEGAIPLKEISYYGVSLIFFFYGLGLSGKKLKAGLYNWKLHFTIQASTFLLFPLLVLLVLPFLKTTEQQILWLAVFYLAALPSTVSSSVVMVSIAGGNISAAIFNASISGLIGIVVTPLLMSLFLSSSQSAEFEFWDVILKLTVQVLAPVFLGVLLHKYLGAWAENHKSKLRLFDKSVILLIVFNSFSESFKSGLFKETSTSSLLLLGVSVIALFFVVYFVLSLLSKLLQFNKEDRITAIFCGSKKSLVHGSVFANVLFAGMSGAGIFLLPIMIYHAFQLFFVSIIARSMQRKKQAATEVKPIIAP